MPDFEASIAPVPTPALAAPSGAAPGEPSAPEPHLDETEIEPNSGWPTLELKELWKCRDLIFYLTLRNIKVRYKQTVLGVLWAVLQPVLFMAAFALALRRAVAPAGGSDLHYPILVLSGLLPWIFFQTAVMAAANSVVSSEGLVTKVYFPRLAIPLSAVAAALLDFAIAFVVLVGMMAWYGIAPTAAIVWLPLSVLLLVMAALGIGTLMAALTVSYRDFRHAVTFGLQVWMLATPTIYISFQPGAAGWLSRLNPMTAPIDFFRGATLGRPISWGAVLGAACFHAVICLIGFLYFRRVEDSFADVI